MILYVKILRFVKFLGLPYKGWTIEGKPCIIKTKNKTIINKRYTLGVSIDYNSNIDFIIKEKSFDSDKFNKFIKK